MKHLNVLNNEVRLEIYSYLKNQFNSSKNILILGMSYVRCQLSTTNLYVKFVEQFKKNMCIDNKKKEKQSWDTNRRFQHFPSMKWNYSISAYSSEWKNERMNEQMNK